jgi:hypothetical protein
MVPLLGAGTGTELFRLVPEGACRADVRFLGLGKKKKFHGDRKQNKLETRKRRAAKNRLFRLVLWAKLKKILEAGGSWDDGHRRKKKLLKISLGLHGAATTTLGCVFGAVPTVRVRRDSDLEHERGLDSSVTGWGLDSLSLS